YLWMSVGGVLGGLFNALIAPVIFNGIVEYPLALVLACLLTPLLEEEKAKPVRLNLGLVLMGCFLGAGVTFLLIARGRTDLDTTGLSGRDGLWLLAALAAALVLVWGARQQEGDDPAARWLDLGLPVTLGVLAVGLNLGLRIPMVHRGVDLIFAQIFDALPDWVPPRLAAFFDPETGGPLILCIFVVPVVFCSFFINRPLRFGLGVGALLLSSTICSLLDEDIHLRQRSFFGVLHVTDDGNFRRLEHGTTLHGQQRFRWSPVAQVANAVGALAASDPLAGTTLLTASQDAMQHPGRDPLTYFHRTGPIGQVFQAYQDKLAKQHVGLIGLGSGTLASYGQPGQKVTYFEIDPLVKHIAFDRANFTYVQDALDRGVQLEVVLGDARLKLEERANQGPPDKLALLVIDAFSSDAIPIHLITREAMDIYLKNLADDGIVVFHISNRYLDLEPVLGNLAAERGLVGYIENDNASGILGKTASSWVVLTRKESKSVLDRLVHEDHWEQWQAEHGWKESSEALQLLSAFPDAEGCLRAQQAVCQSLYQGLRAPWRKLKTRQDMGVWTDDYSNLLRVFDWKN
ncbi:MAG TPA: hypothetical protein VFA18_01720, partial [Gemmataceae bacterium]|nr:hypothetical protein [Gemmataceae bacterium]